MLKFYKKSYKKEQKTMYKLEKIKYNIIKLNKGDNKKWKK